MGNFKVQLPHNLGRLLFGIWLIGMGAVPLLNLQSGGMAFLLGLVLIGSGVCTLIDR